MATLRELRDQGWILTIYCEANEGAFCHNHWTVTWDRLIQYLGLDFDLDAQRAEFLGRFRCERCGRKTATMRVAPPDTYSQMMRGMSSHAYADTRTPAQWDADRQMAAEIKRLAAEGVARVKEQRRALRADQRAKRDRESGRDLIGPPSPWAYRKRGRWL
jgi:hypothetical protein